MHELSIAMSLIDVAEEQAAKLDARVVAIHLRLGPLSGVVTQALLSAYELAREGTLLSRAKLVVQEMPVIAFCDVCNREQTITSIQLMECPVCNTPTPKIISGRELEVTGLEVIEETPSGNVNGRDADPAF